MVLFQVNDGELRAYIFLACLLGFSMYVVMFKTIYKRVLEWIIKVLVALTKGIIKILNTLIIRPIRWIIELLSSNCLLYWLFMLSNSPIYF